MDARDNGAGTGSAKTPRGLNRLPAAMGGGGAVRCRRAVLSPAAAVTLLCAPAGHDVAARLVSGGFVPESGPAVELADIKTAIAQRGPYAAVLVTLCTPALLALFTRNLFLPVKALLMNPLSLTATAGGMGETHARTRDTVRATAVLVPAVMALPGPANWWPPKRIGRREPAPPTHPHAPGQPASEPTARVGGRR
ncbi:hypothetical protein ACFU76_09630 [Streptomyces sp. NPDC057539]|uniref:hypothetical protein n=1 Tax=Streptomyces sp. NPDC057539 TaxID=3346159 RepID=UPI0036BED88E